jgi:hypothetical protein
VVPEVASRDLQSSPSRSPCPSCAREYVHVGVRGRGRDPPADPLERERKGSVCSSITRLSRILPFPTHMQQAMVFSPMSRVMLCKTRSKLSHSISQNGCAISYTHIHLFLRVPVRAMSIVIVIVLWKRHTTVFSALLIS